MVGVTDQALLCAFCTLQRLYAVCARVDARYIGLRILIPFVSVIAALVVTTLAIAAVAIAVAAAAALATATLIP